MLFLAQLLLTVISVASAQVPSWTKDATKLDKKNFQTSCNGKGPSVDLARKEAISECKNSAAEALSKTFSSTSISIQTETGSGFHQEVQNSDAFENLQCEPQKEEIVESPGLYEVWVLCSFAIEKSKLKKSSDNEPQAVTSSMIRGESHTIVLSVIPKCSSVMILGSNPRVVDCNTSPVLVVVSPKDTQLLVRGNSNFLPKHIDLKNKENQDESFQIFLDRI